MEPLALAPAGSLDNAPASEGQSSDLKRLVNGLLSRMGPSVGGFSDDSVMEAGSFGFEDYLREQRSRSSQMDSVAPARDQGKTPKGPVSPSEGSSRLMSLLAQEPEKASSQRREPSPEKKRESSTALLGAATSVPDAGSDPDDATAESSSGAEEDPVLGQSSTYKRAVAKLQTYEAPTPPPLRAVSGFQGLMKTKPSEQTVEQDREGVLSALQLK